MGSQDSAAFRASWSFVGIEAQILPIELLQQMLSEETLLPGVVPGASLDL
jgi:hypothetical protein